MEIKEIASIFKSSLDKLMSFIGSEIQQAFSNRLLEYQVEEYKRNYYAKTILHRAEPKPLRDFYQPLFIKQATRTGYGRKISTQSATKLFSRRNYLTLIGSAGSGKSTIVKYLFTNCFEEHYKIPIKIELRYLNDYKGSFNEYIFNEIFKFQKLGISNTIIDRLIGSDNFVFFFDGYDEVNTTVKAQTTKDIDSFITKYSNNKYVITSRPYTNIDLLPMFSNFYVCDLDENEIASFVKKQIPKDETELAEKIIKAINKSENRSYRSFLSNPLLLSMFILTFQSYSDIPQKRSEFYNQVFETLFSVHDSMSKLAYVREKRCGLSKDQFEEVLRLFSFISFFEEKFLFPSTYLIDKLNTIKTKKKNLIFDNVLFIEDLQVAIGILNKEGLDYTFPHRSLQEYFSASYIEKLSVENKKNIYEKLATEIKEDFFDFLSKDHFFNLLSEIDYNYISKFLAIPLLKYYYQQLSAVSVVDRKVAYQYYGKILLVFYSILKTNLQHRQIHDELISQEITFVYFGGRKNQLEIPEGISDDALLKELNFDVMISKVKHFHSCGDRIIAEIEKNLADLDKSDEEIINLI